MSEERAVQQVLAKYVRGVDTRDGAAVAAVFTEDGRVEISYNNSGKREPLGELVGRETIAAAVSQMMKPHPARGWSHHTTHDHIIDVNGDDATLDAQFVVFEVRGKERPATGWPEGAFGAQAATCFISPATRLASVPERRIRPSASWQTPAAMAQSMRTS